MTLFYKNCACACGRVGRVSATAPHCAHEAHVQPSLFLRVQRRFEEDLLIAGKMADRKVLASADDTRQVPVGHGPVV